MKFIVAVLACWWHALWRLHRTVTWRNKGTVAILECDCGRVFYENEREREFIDLLVQKGWRS